MERNTNSPLLNDTVEFENRIENFNHSIQNVLKLLQMRKKESIIVIEENDEDPKIENFDFHYRGLMFVILHTLHDALYAFNLKSFSSFTKEIKIVNLKLNVLQKMIEASVMIQEKSKNVPYFFPFCDNVDINDKEFEEYLNLDTKIFFSKMGKYYIRGIRKFFGLLVGATASHSVAYYSTNNSI